MKHISKDIYPMPLFVRLEVGDIAASRDWYSQTLGFLDLYSLDGPAGVPLMVHLRWTKYADIMLVPRTTPITKAGEGVAVYMTAERGEVDEIAKRGDNAVIEGPVNRPWNTREVVLLDPDGYRLVFAEGPVDTSSTFEEVMERAKQTQTNTHKS